MANPIAIIGKVLKEYSNNNIATSTYKNIKNLDIDNNLYIKILKENTQIFKNGILKCSDKDVNGIDLIHIIGGKTYNYDVKTQKNLDYFKEINLYGREFLEGKEEERSYVIFNKNNNNKIIGKIYHVTLEFMKEFRSNILIKSFIKGMNMFEKLSQNEIDNDKKYLDFKKKYNNKKIKIFTYIVKISFEEKLYYRNKGNTNFYENIKFSIILGIS